MFTISRTLIFWTFRSLTNFRVISVTKYKASDRWLEDTIKSYLLLPSQKWLSFLTFKTFPFCEISLEGKSAAFFTIAKINFCSNPAGIYLPKVFNRNTKAGLEICSKCFYCLLWTCNCRLAVVTSLHYVELTTWY